MRIIICRGAKAQHHRHKLSTQGQIMSTTSTLQDAFIQRAVDRKVKCAIYLVNGIKLTGIIESHDENCIQLILERTSQLIYKHAVSTIVPQSTD